MRLIVYLKLSLFINNDVIKSVCLTCFSSWFSNVKISFLPISWGRIRFTFRASPFWNPHLNTLLLSHIWVSKAGGKRCASRLKGLELSLTHPSWSKSEQVDFWLSDLTNWLSVEQCQQILLNLFGLSIVVNSRLICHPPDLKKSPGLSLTPYSTLQIDKESFVSWISGSFSFRYKISSVYFRFGSHIRLMKIDSRKTHQKKKSHFHVYRNLRCGFVKSDFWSFLLYKISTFAKKH